VKKTDDNKIEEKVREEYIKYKIIEEQLGTIISQREVIRQNIEDINKTIETIDKISEIKEIKEVWFLLGNDVFVKGNLLNTNKFFVNVGSGIILEKNIEETKNLLNKRIDVMKESLKKIEKNIELQAKRMEEIETRIQKLLNEKKEK